MCRDKTLSCMTKELVEGHGRSQSGTLKEAYIKNHTQKSYLFIFGTVHELSPKIEGKIVVLDGKGKGKS